MATPGSTGSINLVTEASPKVLERFKLKSVTEGIFNHDYKWVGVQTVKIPTIDTVPLSDYDAERVDGGSRYGSLINLGDNWQELPIKQKKSFIFSIDKTYDTQQLQIKKASQCLKRELDEVVIPHLDKYRLQRMAAKASASHHNIASETLTSSNIIKTIIDANAVMSEHLVPEGGRLLYISNKRASDLLLAQQVVGAGPVNKGSLGEKAIVNGVLGEVDGCQIKRVPSSYLPANVEFMIVKKNVALAPMQLREYEIHDGSFILSGKVATGLVQHDCFIPEEREQCIFVVTKSGSGSITIVGTGVLTVTSGTATITSGATSIAKSGGAKNVTVSTVSSGVLTADVTAVDVSDDTIIKAVYDPYSGLITITPLKAGTANLVVTANGKVGYDSPAPVTVAVTVT